MSKIYEYLKEKATNPATKDKIYYTLNNYYEKGDVSLVYTFNDTYDLVNKCINFLKKENLARKDMPCFVPCTSILEDIILTIALMEIGAKPVLINNDTLKVFIDQKETDVESNDNFDLLPLIRLDENNNFKIKRYFFNRLEIYTKKRHLSTKDELKKIIPYNININELTNYNYDFALFTSGTTGKSKIIKMNEDIFINKIKKDYDLNSSELYICSNPISSISGLLFSTYLPIIGNNKGALVNFAVPNSYKDELEYLNYDIYNQVTSTSIFEYDGKTPKYYPVINDDTYSKVNKMTLLGSKISPEIMDYIKKLYPKITKENIEIYYGRTEDYGLVTRVGGDNIKKVYLNLRFISDNRIVYTLDKENIYEEIYQDGKVITNKLDMEYDSDDFDDIANISGINDENNRITLDGPIFGEILIDGESTGDYGFKLFDSIYYLCRSSEIYLTDTTHIYFPWLENFFSKYLISKLYPNTLKDCFFLEDETGYIKMYIPCPVKYYYPNNFGLCRSYLQQLYDMKDRYLISDIVLFNKNYLKQCD